MLGHTKKRPTDEMVTLRLRVHRSNAERVRRLITSIEAEAPDEARPWRDVFNALRPDDAIPSAILRGSRVKEGLTQVQLSEATGIPRRHISEMEHGKRPIGRESARKRTVTLGACLNEDLFHAMQQPESRNALREALLRSCFSEEARAALEEQAGINAEAYSYSLELEEKSHLPLVNETLGTDAYKAAVRAQAFRRIVVSTYDHRCALCGVRIVTPEGHTVVDAAHIVRWSKTQNDDIRNGMALCKLCHWAFDEGMMGVSDNYNVITSRQIGLNPNAPGFLLTLSGRSIIPPPDRDLWPAQQYLGEHRREWRL